jgi:TatD DNase family protein
VIDFHCHLDLYPDPHGVRDECVRRGMYVLSVTTTPSAWTGTKNLAADCSRIRTALGMHPQLAHERKSELTTFDTHLSETQYVGEIGLDGSPNLRRHWDDQVAVFKHILSKCREQGGRIMSIHSRRASAPVLDCLEGNREAGVPILHWFSGSVGDLDRAIKLGCWFSIGPAMFQSEKGRALAKRMPKERILTESDGPFTQIAGEGMKPWDVTEAISQLAVIWSSSAVDVQTQVQDNFIKLVQPSQL